MNSWTYNKAMHAEKMHLLLTMFKSSPALSSLFLEILPITKEKVKQPIVIQVLAELISERNASISFITEKVFENILFYMTPEKKVKHSFNGNSLRVQYRDFVLGLGAVFILLRIAMETDEGSAKAAETLERVTDALCGLGSAGKPYLSLDSYRRVLPFVAAHLSKGDVDSHRSACHALSEFSDGPNDRIQAVVDAGVLPRLVELLGSSDMSVQKYSLRTIGNVATGQTWHTQQVLDAHLLPSLPPLLQHKILSIRKESCWLVSNIAAGSVEQVQQLLDAEVYPILIQGFVTDAWDVKREVAWAICNAATSGTTAQKIFLANLGVVPLLVKLLTFIREVASSKDMRLGGVILEGLLSFLEAGAAGYQVRLTNNPIVQLVSVCNGFSELKKWNNSNTTPQVETYVTRILSEFCAENNSGITNVFVDMNI